MFSTFEEGFSLISPKLHRFADTHTHNYRSAIMLSWMEVPELCLWVMIPSWAQIGVILWGWYSYPWLQVSHYVELNGGPWTMPLSYNTIIGSNRCHPLGLRKPSLPWSLMPRYPSHWHILEWSNKMWATESSRGEKTSE